MNKKTILRVAAVSLLTAIATSAVASSQGPYIGGQLGYGITHESGMSTSNESGLAGRLYTGYQINPYIGGEFGWTKFSNASDTASYAILPGYTLNSDYTVKTSALDLVAKMTYPVANNINLYGKLGVAYVMATENTKVDFNDTEVTSDSHNEYQFLPTFGVGASYNFTPKVAADVAYNRIQQTGGSDINSTDFFGVGLTYSFS